jgi:hypothetical protein
LKPKAIFALAILILITVPLISASRPSAQTSPQIIYKVPITISNNESIPTLAPFQEMLVVNSSAYSLFEAGNLQNVEFYYQNGTLIPSWLESGNASTSNTIYWLNLEHGIPANSNLKIYMGFASIPTSLFDGKVVGEAPTLSPTYGEFDNGQTIFPFYTNFNGTAMPEGFSHITPIPNGSTLSFDNGVKISGGPNRHLVQLFYDTSYDPEVYSYDVSASFSGTGALEYTSASSAGSPGMWLEGMGVFSNINTKNLVLTDGLTGQNQFSVANTTYPATSKYIVSVWQTSNATFGAVNYNQFSGSKNFTAETTLFPEMQNSLNNNFDVNWIRIRTLPPNGMIPAAAFGQVALALTSTSGTSPSTSTSSEPTISKTAGSTSTSERTTSSTSKVASYGSGAPNSEGFSSSFIFFSAILIGMVGGITSGSFLMFRKSRKTTFRAAGKSLTPTQKAKVAQLDRLLINGLISQSAHDSGIDKILSR